MSTQTLIWRFHYRSSLSKWWNILNIRPNCFPFSSAIVLDLDLTAIVLSRLDDISTSRFPITYRTINQKNARITVELEIWLCFLCVYTCFISLISQKHNLHAISCRPWSSRVHIRIKFITVTTLCISFIDYFILRWSIIML